MPPIKTPWRPLPATEIGVSIGRVGGQGREADPPKKTIPIPPFSLVARYREGFTRGHFAIARGCHTKAYGVKTRPGVAIYARPVR